jgi:hypothetical protein
MSDEEDDAIIDQILDEGTVTQIKKGGEKGKQDMSSNPKDMVGRQTPTPVISREESDAITEWKELQKANALFKKKHGLQGYSIDEINASGNKLNINENKVNERKALEKELVDKMIKEDRETPKAVAHSLDGKTKIFKEEVPKV